MKMVMAEVEGMSGGELLDHAAEVAGVRDRCEVEILRVAVQHAYLHAPETLDPAESRRPGRERARRCGGVGAPEVTEFAAAELGARLGVSTVSAWLLMADGLDICHRLPRLWGRVVAGEVRVYLARLVAKRTRDLTPVQAAYVDARVAEYADGRLTWSRFQALVDGVVAAADPEGTAAAEQKAGEQQLARPTRVNGSNQSEGDGHGLRGFYIRAPFATVAVFDAALQRIADILRDLGDPDPVDRRRVKALLVLARPDLAADLIAGYRAWRDRPGDPLALSPEAPPEVPPEAPPETPSETPPEAPPEAPPELSSGVARTGEKPVIDWTQLLPQVVVHVHVYAAPDAEGIARVEGCGPMTEAWVKHHLSPHAQVTVRPVLDVDGLAPVDAYEIPDRHRRAVRLMTPADTFPFSPSLHPDQIDHTEPYRHGPDAAGAGQSRIGNYAPMTTPHHRLKTHGRWTVKQPFPGLYLWRDPHGTLYLVDHTGTRPLPRTHAA